MKILVQKFFRACGYGTGQREWNRTLTYTISSSLLTTIKDHTMLSPVRLQTLANAVLHVVRNGIEGDIVQCGVWRGGSAALMAQVVKETGRSLVPIHLFDSFEGIPEPDAKVDGTRAVAEAKNSGVGTDGKLIPNPHFYSNMGRSVGYIEDVKMLLENGLGYDHRFINYHKGMFEEVIPSVHGGIESISVLHLDGDWYSSTKVCLEYLFDKVVSGGLVLIDDYGAYDGCRRAVDEFFDERGISSYLHQVDSEMIVFEKS